MNEQNEQLHQFKPEGVGRLGEQLCEMMVEDNLTNIHAHLMSSSNPEETKIAFGMVLVRDTELWNEIQNTIRAFNSKEEAGYTPEENNTSKES